MLTKKREITSQKLTTKGLNKNLESVDCRDVTAWIIECGEITELTDRGT